MINIMSSTWRFICFLALDPDWVNEEGNGAKFTDLGENVDLSCKSSYVSPNMLTFLNSDL